MAGGDGTGGKTEKLGYLGLGMMGFPMARRLIGAGYDITVWNRSSGKAAAVMAGPWLAADLRPDLVYKVAPLPTISGVGQMRPYLTVDAAFLTPEGSKSADARALARFFGGRPGDEPVARGMGSGVAFSPDGAILTNTRVVDEALTINVRFRDGRYLPARLVGRDPATDLAVVKVDTTGLTPAKFADSEPCKHSNSCARNPRASLPTKRPSKSRNTATSMAWS